MSRQNIIFAPHTRKKDKAIPRNRRKKYTRMTRAMCCVVFLSSCSPLTFFPVDCQVVSIFNSGVCNVFFLFIFSLIHCHPWMARGTLELPLLNALTERKKYVYCHDPFLMTMTMMLTAHKLILIWKTWRNKKGQGEYFTFLICFHLEFLLPFFYWITFFSSSAGL